MNKNQFYRKYLQYDMLAALLVWIAFFIFRKTINDIRIFDSIHVLIPNYDYITSLVLFPIYCVFVHYLTGIYMNAPNKDRLTLILSTLVSTSIISVTVFFFMRLGDLMISYQYFYFSLLVLFSFGWLAYRFYIFATKKGLM